MKGICPDCGKKILDKHYDDDMGMYECPKCEGMFEYAELEQPEVKSSTPVAKAKKKEQAQADAVKKADELVVTTKGEQPEKIKHEVPTGQIIEIMSDAIEEIYHEFGGRIERYNAKDKALNLYRVMAMQGSGVKVREKSYKVPACRRHSA